MSIEILYIELNPFRLNPTKIFPSPLYHHGKNFTVRLMNEETGCCEWACDFDPFACCLLACFTYLSLLAPALILRGRMLRDTRYMVSCPSRFTID